MKIPAIKKLVENYTKEQLSEAENNIYDEKNPSIEVDGSDEGEQLTHILGALWIKEEMRVSNSEFMVALRKYTSRVRESIS